MKLMVQSWNNGTSSYNAETEETNFLSYHPSHRFNNPCKCDIRIFDADGSMAQKYNVDANDVYVGVGKVTVEDPTGTDIFYGRIQSAEPNPSQRELILHCEDWLCQFNDAAIDYDCREDLDGAGLRESKLYGDRNGNVTTERAPVYTTGTTYYAYDNQMSWANNAFDGMNMILTAKSAGPRTIAVGPYTSTTTVTAGGGNGSLDFDTFDTDISSLWDDDSVGHLMQDNDDDSFTEDYTFRVYANKSSMFVSGSITRAEFEVVYFLSGTASVSGTFYFWDSNSSAWVALKPDSNKSEELLTGDEVNTRLKFTIPETYLQGFLTSGGLAQCRFDITMDPANITKLRVQYLMFEIDLETYSTSSAIGITDTINPDTLQVDTDLYSATIALWEGCPYCIADEINTKINGLVTDNDGQVTLTTSVESTTGICADKFEQTTVLDIMRSFAERDGAVFWLALGGTVVYYKKTTDAAATAITDASVSRWISSGYDVKGMFNKYTVRGVRVGDVQIEESYSDATSIAKYNTTRSKTVNSQALSPYEALSIATALVNRDKDIKFNLGFEVSGLSSYRLGDYLEVTSSWLGISAVNYTVVSWDYDSRTNMTTIYLEPSTTYGYSNNPKTIMQATQNLYDSGKREVGAKYNPYPSSDVLA